MTPDEIDQIEDLGRALVSLANDFRTAAKLDTTIEAGLTRLDASQGILAKLEGLSVVPVGN